MSDEYLLASKRCNECLYSPNKIVSNHRRGQILTVCRAERRHFVCHKARGGPIVTCRGWHDAEGPSDAMLFALAFDIPVREVDPDTIERVQSC